MKKAARRVRTASQEGCLIRGDGGLKTNQQTASISSESSSQRISSASTTGLSSPCSRSTPGHLVGIGRGVEAAVGQPLGERLERFVLLGERLFDLGELLLQGLAKRGDALALLRLGAAGLLSVLRRLAFARLEPFGLAGRLFGRNRRAAMLEDELGIVVKVAVVGRHRAVVHENEPLGRCARRCRSCETISTAPS